jgi:hypothetical protein
MGMKNPWLASASDGATGQTFEIRTVKDFLTVPEDRRRICLREFDAWLSLQVSVKDLILAAANALGTSLPDDAIQMQEADVFRWIDDGLATMSVTLEPARADDAVDPVGERVTE